MPRPRPTIKRAIATCVRALIAVSHRVPLIGFIVGGLLAWLAVWMRSHPAMPWEIVNRIAFWVVVLIAACFLILAMAGFIETITGRRRASRANAPRQT
ncbi:MAG: hypothetical protein H7Z14_05270 [Anaerolineae bacterium]|nr:hypothetical protein [Phycisphaerae bacterium]